MVLTLALTLTLTLIELRGLVREAKEATLLVTTSMNPGLQEKTVPL